MFRNRLKNLLADALYRTGLSSLLLRWRFRGRMVVLTYHRVLPAHERAASFSHEAIMVELDAFDRHLAVLNRHFTCLRLDEFSAGMRCNDPSGRPECLITFDDAWQDNYTHAFPILRKWGTPAVIFVPTDYIGTGSLFWQERLGHIIDRICTRLPEDAARLLEKYEWSHLTSYPQMQRRDAIKTAIRAIKHKNHADINHIITDLAGALGDDEPDYGPDTYLSTEQMREMMQFGISFQSHGCSHRVFPRLTAEELGTELQLSRRWLHKQLGADAIALAYPNGDHTPATLAATEQAGYTLAFTTIPGHVDRSSNPFDLRRINLNDNVAGSEARLMMALLFAGR
ncbi:polysaccharide deacetylase family protein [Aquamicrobium sp.]|uniref:polysaccharide deacetylase family protein n=1 Tax=Aquamicrobium sp. TaxID=1872579 RepID=UPI002588B5F8|nr:polysaccharide deacetylase family protein [Aquamicrobium sp.]MCK9553889.1 polysaccharide deacetylase family protein [Aquamicrobium sp.]